MNIYPYYVIVSLSHYYLALYNTGLFQAIVTSTVAVGPIVNELKLDFTFSITLLISAVVVFLFLAGLWFTGAIINGPNSHPKLTLAAPTIGYRRIAASHIDWPSRTL